MKEFSLIHNDGNEYPELPSGLILVFGIKRQAIVFTDYEGNADRPQPSGIRDDWFPLGKDFDSIMAWHGERKSSAFGNIVKINWKRNR